MTPEEREAVIRECIKAIKDRPEMRRVKALEALLKQGQQAKPADLPKRVTPWRKKMYPEY